MPRTKQFNEQEVLNRAMELFWEKGFHATSMQDLVSHLGINRASLYDTFGGKEALFDSAFAHYRTTSGEKIQEIFHTSATIKEGFQRLFEMAIEEAANDPGRKGCFVVNTTTEMIPGNEKIHQTLIANKENAENLFAGYVQKGINNGELSPSINPQEIGLMLFALYNGIRVVAKVDSDAEKLRKVVNSGLSVLD